MWGQVLIFSETNLRLTAWLSCLKCPTHQSTRWERNWFSKLNFQEMLWPISFPRGMEPFHDLKLIVFFRVLAWSEYICFFQGLGMFLSCLSVLGAEGEAARTCRSSILEYRYDWSYMKAGTCTGTGTYVLWYAKATKPFDIIRLLHCFLSKKTQQAYMDLVKTLVVNTLTGGVPSIHAFLHPFFCDQVWVTADHWHPRPSTIPSDGPPHSTPVGTWLIINTATVVDCIFSLFDMSFFVIFKPKNVFYFPPSVAGGLEGKSCTLLPFPQFHFLIFSFIPLALIFPTFTFWFSLSFSLLSFSPLSLSSFLSHSPCSHFPFHFLIVLSQPSSCLPFTFTF